MSRAWRIIDWLLTVAALPALVIFACAGFFHFFPDDALSLRRQEFARQGENLYRSKNCESCHGPRGDEPIGPEYPRLRGQSAVYLQGQALDIRDGKRSNRMSEMMQAQLHHVSDDDIEKIALYLESLR
jgi:cytochrome c